MNAAAMVVDEIDKLFAKVIDRNLLAAAEAGSMPVRLQQLIAEIGLESALVGEVDGGIGLRWREVAEVFEAIGYHAVPLPVGESMIANWALAKAALPRPEGLIGLCPSVLQMQLDGAVSGRAEFVPWGQVVNYVAAVADCNGDLKLCLLPVSDAQPVKTIGRDPRATLTFANVRPLHVASVPEGLAQDGFVPLMAALRGSQMAGALGRVLSLSIEYANTRVQFGRPIGKFQAIQHLVAEMAAETAAAQVAANLCWRRLDSGFCLASVAVSKIRTGKAAGKGAAIAHEIHGAIGVTEEHILSYFTRRLWQWRNEAGNEHVWSDQLGELLLVAGGDKLWQNILEVSGLPLVAEER